MTVCAVVLAAGAGRRFEGPTHKLLAPFRGRPVVAWAVEHAVAAGLDETVVVTGCADLADVLAPFAAHITIVANPGWEGGVATSLRVAVDHATSVGHRALVVGQGDQPMVDPEAWRLVAHPEMTPVPPIVIATYDGRRASPRRLDASIWSMLPSDGEWGADGLARQNPELVGEVACPGEPTDIDTTGDLRTWS